MYKSLVEDETDYLDIGFSKMREFFSFSLHNLDLSYQDTFPSKYKIAGFSVFRHLDVTVYNRSTYDVLACLGDIGGLEGIILILGGLLIKKITEF